MTLSYRGPSAACIGVADPGPTLRGAKTRDPKAWAYYLNRVIELFGEHRHMPPTGLRGG